MVKSNRYLCPPKLIHTPGFNLAARHADDVLKPNYTICSPPRPLPSSAERILDAPDLLDDYYLNLLDWGKCLSIALSNTVYLWDEGKVNQSVSTSSNITSLSWQPESNNLAIGKSDSGIEIIDTLVNKSVRNIAAHRDRISSLAWRGNVLTSGSRDSRIFHHDPRAKDYFMQFQGHAQEVCGLKWSDQFLASGSNDNCLKIWELGYTSPLLVFCEHKAAVKGLAWSPHDRSVLASGGGTSDKTIKIWNVKEGVMKKSVHTGSQVCGLEWSKHTQEILSIHGFADNCLSVWKYPGLQKVGNVLGHTARVLYLAQDQAGNNIATAGADETLRFWKIFAKEDKANVNSIYMDCR
jgi:WD40 repeat protein